jgi:hypothetical protein
MALIVWHIKFYPCQCIDTYVCTSCLLFLHNNLRPLYANYLKIMQKVRNHKRQAKFDFATCHFFHSRVFNCALYRQPSHKDLNSPLITINLCHLLFVSCNQSTTWNYSTDCAQCNLLTFPHKLNTKNQSYKFPFTHSL